MKPRISVIDYEESRDRLREIYDEIIEKRGKLAEVHKIQSLHPESIIAHMDLYLEIMYSRSELSRIEREMMGVLISAINGCDYCRLHHSQALLHYWKNEEKIRSLTGDYQQAGLTNREEMLCRYAQSLTLEPGAFSYGASLDFLKEVSLSDSAILDATLVIAYFNFVNRIVLALGIEASGPEITGYKY
ncbi:MAG: peroxidase-related enzyme [Bacteroidetes bacterium]|nr:peroxidase-related enzyme [Bacteroidota bacterium]